MAKIALVTGGSRGIGAATCRLLAANGYAVAVNYRAGRDAPARVVADIEAAGGRALAVQADIAVEAEVLAMFATVDRELGTLDYGEVFATAPEGLGMDTGVATALGLLAKSMNS